MVRSWSNTAVEVLDSYPWRNAVEKDKARAEAELVSFGEQVEIGDLPLFLRQWWMSRRQTSEGRYQWQGESWEEATMTFETAILSQVLAAQNWNVAAAARALKTTPRIVRYKARKYGLIKDSLRKEK